MTLKIAIAGAGGRMGRQLIQAVHNAEGAELGAAFERKGQAGKRRVHALRVGEGEVPHGDFPAQRLRMAVVGRVGNGGPGVQHGGIAL